MVDKKLRDAVCDFMGISVASYYRWKEKRPVIKMLEKYFSAKDLQEFMSTGKIGFMEKGGALNAFDPKIGEFFFSSAISKVITKSTLPFDDKDIVVRKLFSEVLYKNKQYSVLPLSNFLDAFQSSLSSDLEELLVLFDKEEISDSHKKILINFCRVELSEIEYEALFKQKERVLSYFTTVKRDKYCLLNF